MNRCTLNMLLRSIRRSLGRYLAILGIVALGVGFFAGLKSSFPAMHRTADDYLRRQHFHDFQLLSTLGFAEGDRAAFEQIDGVSAAEGAYFADAYIEHEGKRTVCRLMSITEHVDIPELTAGRMPRAAWECLGDNRIFSESDIGTSLSLGEDNDEDTRAMFPQGSYTIVGLARSPRYISSERGDTTLGSGRIEGFVLLLPQSFDSEAYHELLLWCDLPGEIYSEEYDAARARLEGQVRSLQNSLGTLRRRELREEADEKLADGRRELDEGWQEYRDKRAETEAELDEAQKKLDDGAEELARRQTELDDGRARLEAGMAQLPAARQQIEENRALLDEKQAELEAGRAELEAGEEELAMGAAQLEAYKALSLAPSAERIASATGEISLLRSSIAAAENAPGGELLLPTLQSRLQEKIAELNAAQAEYASVEASFSAQEAEIASGREQLAAARAQLEAGQSQLDDGYAQLEDAARQIAAAEAAYPTYLQELEDGQQKLDEAAVELEEGRIEYENGRREAEEAFAEAEAELKDAEAALRDAAEEADEQLKLELYTLDRESNPGYLTFDNDTRIVDALSDVFPIFFVLVAALVCITTMTRMVGEERTIIGTMKALGYSTAVTMSKYLLYAASASLLGCVAGYFIGTLLIPYFVWFAYRIIYDYAHLDFYFSPLMWSLCLLVTVPGSLLVTFLVCRRELRERPAELIRPKAPKNGRRILLERITPLWRPLPFLTKLSLRNAFRFPVRVAMLLLGIGGCTALLVAGLGARDSIAHISSYQYDEIMLYDLEVKLDEEVFLPGGEAVSLWKENCDAWALTRRESVTLKAEGKEKSTNMIAASPGALEGLISLHDGAVELPFPGKGEAVITKKIAETMSLQAGDSFTLTTDAGEELSVRVTGVCDNYLRHFVFIDLGSLPGAEANTALLHCAEGTDPAALGAALRTCEGVSYVSLTQQERETMENSMRSMDVLIALVVACSGALAFITLYNLTNINIMERVREIATVKVLGFYRKETAAYVLRENVLLSVLGAAFGLLLGKGLHLIIIRALVVEYMSFDVRVTALSYCLAFAATMLFTLLTNAAMHRHLAAVDMAESLKSVE
ncbi:MAG: FtsX-like permease family protein [Oscillospiraceae bacterium]|nr:FtsX-like permease family protein [Oscillospiraceae bacterium]